MNLYALDEPFIVRNRRGFRKHAQPLAAATGIWLGGHELQPACQSCLNRRAHVGAA